MSGASFPRVFAGRRFAVMGLGRNGLAAAKALAAMGAGVTAWDDSPEARRVAREAGIALADPLAGTLAVEALVLSPGIPHHLPAPHPVAVRAAEAGIPIISDAELLFAAVRAAGSRARFIGITGTNGKSTTSALLAHILVAAGIAVAAGGNLGPAALALPLLGDGGCYVLEMSSYMLERIAALCFDAAVLLNLSPDHLDRHGDMAGYVAAKRRIFGHRAAGGLAVVGIDDQPSRDIALTITGPGFRISGNAAADVGCENGTLRDRTGVILPMVDAPALPGEHNAQNAAAAAAVALHLGVPRPVLAAAICSFPGLPHRLERVCRVGGVLFVNDSKATNADSAARALLCYPRLVWILGGIAKAGGIEPLAPHFPRIAEALLIGRDAPMFAETLARYRVPHRIVERLEAAVPAALAAARARAAPVVLLSPAAASFDQFQSFEQRGARFADLARSLEAADGKAA